MFIMIKQCSVNLFLLYALAGFLCLSFLPHLDLVLGGLYNEKRILQACLLSLVTLYVLRITYVHKTAAVVCLLFLALNVLFSKNQLSSLTHVLHYMLLFFLFLAFYANSHLTKNVFLILVISISVISVFSFLNIIIQALHLKLPTAFETYYGFYNIRFFNQFQLATLPAVYFLLCNAETAKYRNSILLLLSFNMFLLVLGLARGALISWFVFCFFIYYFEKKHAKTLLLSSLFACFLSSLYLLAIWLIFDSGPYLNITTSSGRLDIWFNIVAGVTLESALIGHGLGSFSGFDYTVSHPHNIVMSIIHDLGVLAALCIGWLTFTILRSQINIRKDTQYLTLAGTILCMLVYALASGVTVMPVPQTILVILIGLWLGQQRPSSSIIATRPTIKWVIPYISIVSFYYVFMKLSFTCTSPIEYGPSIWSNGYSSFTFCQKGVIHE